jgi:hypothetical protein
VAELERLQRSFLAVVTNPDGAAGVDPARAAELVTASEALAPGERIGVYAGMYHARLFEVLEEDHPGLVALLGGDAARALFRAYLAAHPSRHPNLNRLGCALPGFLAEREGASFAAELTRLERDVQDAFDASRAAALSAEDLAGVPQERWGELRLALVPAVRLGAFRHPVNAWYQAFREGETRPAPEPAPSWLVVYRRQERVWRLELEPAAHRLLAVFAHGGREGAALGEALELLAADGLLDAAVPRLQGWFRDWAGMGLFAALA